MTKMTFSLVILIVSLCSTSSWAQLPLSVTQDANHIALAMNQIKKIPTKQVKQWQQQAKQGDKKAQYQLGMAYMMGTIDPVGFTRASEHYQQIGQQWLQKSAAQQFGPAENQIGNYYFVQGKMNKAKEFYLRAIQHHEPEAYASLGYLAYFTDRKKAIAYFKKGVAQGNFNSAIKLILLAVIEKNFKPKLAIKIFKQAVKNAGKKRYHNPNGTEIYVPFLLDVTKDHNSKAFKNSLRQLFLKAARQGFPYAQTMLCLNSFKRFSRTNNASDAENAFSWCYQSALRNDALTAGFIYGYYEAAAEESNNPYFKKKRNYWQKKMLTLALPEATLGEPASINLLGNYFFDNKNYKKAYYWYHKGAKEQDADSAIGLAELYSNGFGVKQDSLKAQYWQKQAAIFDQSRPQWIAVTLKYL